jgi:hypothetical protein
MDGNPQFKPSSNPNFFYQNLISGMFFPLLHERKLICEKILITLTSLPWQLQH